MKKLESEGVGSFLSEGTGDKAFYKLLPEERNKDAIERFVTFSEYKKNFLTEIGKSLSEAQQKRLLDKSPDKDILVSEYGYK